jgi:sugar phosphate isomerase/epimerase
MSLDAAIAAMKQIRIGECELYMGHVEPQNLKGQQLTDWRMSVPLTHFKDVRQKFDNAGIELWGYSLNMRDNWSDAELDRAFQMTKALGTDIITTSTTLTCAKRLGGLAEKYRVKVALHGHDETSRANEFSSPDTFARGLSLSPQFYINLDIGHFAAAGFDPVPYIEQHHARILNLHIKDRKRDHGPGTPFGKGDTPIRQVLDLLKQSHYPMVANIEYEYNDDIPGLETVTEVRKCFDYCKNVLQT